MDPALKAATLGASQLSAPGGNPLGASNAPELAKLYAASFQLPQLKAAVGAQTNIAQIKQKADEDAAKIAAQQAQDQGDIKAYKIVKKTDGGYDYFDPTGKQVDIATVSHRTGASPSDLVADSENPIDIQYRNDHKNLQDYVSAVLSGDKKTVQAFQASEPMLKKYTDKGGIQKLIDQFKSSYQRYYTVNWGANVPKNPLVPTAATGTDALLGNGGI